MMEHLKRFRLSLGLTSLEMSVKLGISYSLYDKIERGERNASNAFLRKFSKIFPSYDLTFFLEAKHTKRVEKIRARKELGSELVKNVWEK
jgi:transcriptional regulator with XRE-family HTH domain